jgi:hypothetical protein
MCLCAPLSVGWRGKSAVAHRLCCCHHWQFCLICCCATYIQRCEENTIKCIWLLNDYGTLRIIPTSTERNDQLRDCALVPKMSRPLSIRLPSCWSAVFSFPTGNNLQQHMNGRICSSTPTLCSDLSQRNYLRSIRPIRQEFEVNQLTLHYISESYVVNRLLLRDSFHSVYVENSNVF